MFQLSAQKEGEKWALPFPLFLQWVPVPPVFPQPTEGSVWAAQPLPFHTRLGERVSLLSGTLVGLAQSRLQFPSSAAPRSDGQSLLGGEK